MENVSEYNDEKAVEQYLRNHEYHFFMTDLERRCMRLATMLIKAETYAAVKEHDDANRYFAMYEAEANAETRPMLERGPKHFFDTVRERIRQDYWAGKIVINRCPECSRVLRTPHAKQCLWCGADWHQSAPS